MTQAAGNTFVADFMAELKAKNPGEPEFHQAAMEVAESLDVRARQASRSIAR